MSRRMKQAFNPEPEPDESRARRFYEDDTALARIVAEFLHEGFEAGTPGIVVATADQRAAIVRELTVRSVDVEALQRSRDLVLRDAQDILSTFMVDGKPHASKFRYEICQLIGSVRSARTNCTVRMFGQVVDVLWQRGDRDAAIRLERLWNQLAQTEASSLICGYAIGHFYKDVRFENVDGRPSPSVATDEKAIQTASAACDTNRRSVKRRGR